MEELIHIAQLYGDSILHIQGKVQRLNLFLSLGDTVIRFYRIAAHQKNGRTELLGSFFEKFTTISPLVRVSKD